MFLHSILDVIAYLSGIYVLRYKRKEEEGMSNKEFDSNKNVELRKSKRVDYYSKIYCRKYIEDGQAKEPEPPLELILINVSVGGLGVVSEQHFSNGTVLVLDITLEGELYEKVSARVMWGIKKGDMYRHGLEIMNISGKLYSHLNKFDNSITTIV